MDVTTDEPCVCRGMTADDPGTRRSWLVVEQLCVSTTEKLHVSLHTCDIFEGAYNARSTLRYFKHQSLLDCFPTVAHQPAKATVQPREGVCLLPYFVVSHYGIWGSTPPRSNSQRLHSFVLPEMIPDEDEKTLRVSPRFKLLTALKGKRVSLRAYARHA